MRSDYNCSFTIRQTLVPCGCFFHVNKISKISQQNRKPLEYFRCRFRTLARKQWPLSRETKGKRCWSSVGCCKGQHLLFGSNIRPIRLVSVCRHLGAADFPPLRQVWGIPKALGQVIYRTSWSISIKTCFTRNTSYESINNSSHSVETREQLRNDIVLAKEEEEEVDAGTQPH